MSGERAISRAGFVALIGQPNTGKSTLLNRLLGEKVAIVTSRPQTTRNRILGVYTREALQIAFLDTPGIHEGRQGLNKYMVNVALAALAEVDVVLFMVDAKKAARRKAGEVVDPGDRSIVQHLAHSGRPVVLGLNKIDKISPVALLPIIDAYQALHGWEEVFPFSALKGDGVERLVALLADHLPEGPAMFDPDTWTDQAERMLVAEYIREQVIRNTRDELPFTTAVEIVEFDESERAAGLVRIEANVVVERDSQKGIVIGKRGAMLKRIGTAARKEIAVLLGCKVWLGLRVRVERDWTRSQKGLRKLGYA